MRDERRGKFCKSWLALSIVGHEAYEGSLRVRENSHANEIKKSQDKSCFHNHHLDENCAQASKSSKRGNFQYLRFASYLRFKNTSKSKIQDLFHWIEDLINHLSIRKLAGHNSLFDKNTD